MSVVLGIDAAWTAGQPSGVAALRRERGRWHCVALAPSYTSFVALARGMRVDWQAPPRPTDPRCDELIAATRRLAGAEPDVIAIDMPLSKRAITCRRVADNAIARAYATRGLGAHSPSAERPGPVADEMRRGFARLGYALACTTTRPGTRGVMIEVFPHAAAIALLGASYRVPYKLARVAQYWPNRSPLDRRRALLAQWRRLRHALPMRVALRVPQTGALASLKRYEDALDAALCAWIATEYLAGRTRPYGDATAAVWAH